MGTQAQNSRMPWGTTLEDETGRKVREVGCVPEKAPVVRLYVSVPELLYAGIVEEAVKRACVTLSNVLVPIFLTWMLKRAPMCLNPILRSEMSLLMPVCEKTRTIALFFSISFRLLDVDCTTVGNLTS